MKKEDNSYKELAVLIEQISAGNQEAFEEYYLKTYKAQYYLAVKNTHDYELAKDVVQEVYIRLLNYIGKIEDLSLVVSYMNKMNYSISIDLLKKRNELQTIDYEGIDMDFAISQEDSDDDYIYNAINELDEELREVVMLRYINKIRVKDIALSKNLSTRTINRMLKKALAGLRISIKDMRNASFIFLPISWCIRMYMNVNNMNINVSTVSKIYTEIAKVTWTLPTSLSTNRIVEAMNSKIIIPQAFIVAGAGTVVLMGALFLIPPRFDVIRENSSMEFTNQEIFYIKKQSLTNVDKINIYDEWGNIYVQGYIDGDGRLKINRNGNYKIELIDSLGRLVTKNIIISTIDETSPELVSANYINGQYEITIVDDLSGIDIESIKINGNNEQSLSYKIMKVDSNTVTIIINTAQDQVDIDVIDLVGNINSLNIKLE